MFIDEECGNLIAVNDGGKLSKDINQNKKPDVSQQPIDVHSVINVLGNQLGNHDFSCGPVVNNLKNKIKQAEIALTQFLLAATGIIPPCRI